MQRKVWKRALLVMLGLSVAACVSPSGGGSDRIGATSAGKLVTVQPREIDDVLYNPGMGFADFHFGFGHPPKPDEYPHTTVAYFRWPWAELEPAEGQYNFALIDGIIAQAKAKGETLAIRIVSEYKTGTPKWVLDKGVGS
ncbi:MAG TPA: beta-galactosidase, partial [Nitrospira sp.]|nr:beta-galactosidase [Nitrospira sp.]